MGEGCGWVHLNAQSVQHVHDVFRRDVAARTRRIWATTQSRYRRVNDADAWGLPASDARCVLRGVVTVLQGHQDVGQRLAVGVMAVHGQSLHRHRSRPYVRVGLG